MKTVFVLFDSLNRHMLASLWRHAHPDSELRPAGQALRHLRPPLCRQLAVHAGAPRHAHRAAVVSAPQLGTDGAVRQRLSRAPLRGRRLQPPDHRPLSTIGRTAAPPITTATTPTSSCADRKAIRGRPWCSRSGNGCARCITSASSTRASATTSATTSSTGNSFARNPSFRRCRCFAHGFEFLEQNRNADNWLLQIETFDPHEPFYAPARFKKPFETGWNGPIRDWPRYGRVDELPAECEELRANYYAVVGDVRLPAGRATRRFRPPRHVEGHGAGRHHRPWLPAR